MAKIPEQVSELLVERPPHLGWRVTVGADKGFMLPFGSGAQVSRSPETGVLSTGPSCRLIFAPGRRSRSIPMTKARRNSFCSRNVPGAYHVAASRCSTVRGGGVARTAGVPTDEVVAKSRYVLADSFRGALPLTEQQLSALRRPEPR